jgi:hypothetical protein
VVNTLDSSFFVENIRTGYQLRKEHQADRGKEPVEIAAHIYEIIKNSNQIVHNRGKALAYLSGKSREGPSQRPARKAPHQFERAVGLQGHRQEEALFAPGGPAMDMLRAMTGRAPMAGGSQHQQQPNAGGGSQ